MPQPPNTPPNSTIGFKSVAKYALLPGIIPMIRRLAERFGQFLFMFTQIFGLVGLIDKNHPCLRPENAGRYRFVDIIGVAAHNVRFDGKHIPQIVMFFSVILTVVLLIAFVVIGFLFSTTLIGDAHAQFYSPSTGGAYTRQSDWAFIFLNNMFGQTGIGSLIWTLSDSDPVGGASRLHKMFRAMLQHYSMALLVLAVFQVIYIIVATLIDTAQTGKPFGQKFNNVWAPIRFVVAIGLMVPISAGYNSAQLIVFQMTDWGSSLATNVWIKGLEKFGDENYLQASTPDKGYRFVRALWLSEVCMASFNTINAEGSNTFVDGMIVGAEAVSKYLDDISPMMHDKPAGESWNAFVQRINGGPASRELVFRSISSSGDDIYYDVKYGTVGDPDYCGSFRIPKEQGKVNITTLSGQVKTINSFGQLISGNYSKVFGVLQKDMATTAKKYVSEVKSSCSYADAPSVECKHKQWIIDTYWRYLGFNNADYGSNPCSTSTPTAKNETRKSVKFFVTPSYRNALTDTNKAIFDFIQVAQRGGWASAGAYYMTISYANGVLSNSIGAIPTVITLPAALANEAASPVDPTTGDKIDAFVNSNFSALFGRGNFSKEVIKQAHDIMKGANKWFQQSPHNNSYLTSWIGEQFYNSFNDDEDRLSSQQNTDIATDQRIKPLVYDTMLAIRDTNVNPLGRLVAMGNAFLSYSLILYSIGIAGSTGIFGSSAWGSIFTQVATLFGLAGFSLSLYLPMMPFIYFMFAVIEWVMGVLEAIIGMPLWAMSMITVEGDGLGKLGQQNFMKLIGIMLQPTIIVISLIASLIIFSAALSYWNNAFALFADSYRNTAGASESTLESFGAGMVGFVAFTFLYVFTCYSIGQSCFKLIRKLPDVFVSWIGAPSSFSGEFDAGLAGFNQYVGMNQLKSLQDAATSSGTAAVKNFKDGANNVGVNAERERANAMLTQSMEANQKAQAAEEVVRAPGYTATDEEKQAAKDLRNEANVTSQRATRARDLYTAKTGADLNPEGIFSPVTTSEFKKYSAYKEDSNFMKRLGNPSYAERQEQEMLQTADGLPEQRAKKEEEKRRANIQSAINDDEAMKRGLVTRSVPISGGQISVDPNNPTSTPTSSVVFDTPNQQDQNNNVTTTVSGSTGDNIASTLSNNPVGGGSVTSNMGDGGNITPTSGFTMPENLSKNIQDDASDEMKGAAKDIGREASREIRNTTEDMRRDAENARDDEKRDNRNARKDDDLDDDR